MFGHLKNFVGRFVATSAVAVLLITGAQAAGIQELGAPTSKTTLLSLGTAPEKKNIVLNLGELRTGEAELPPGPLSLADRARLRARLAAERQSRINVAARRPSSNRVKAGEAQVPEIPEEYRDEGAAVGGEERPAPGDIPEGEGPLDVAGIEGVNLDDPGDDEGGDDPLEE